MIKLYFFFVNRCYDNSCLREVLAMPLYISWVKQVENELILCRGFRYFFADSFKEMLHP